MTIFYSLILGLLFEHTGSFQIIKVVIKAFLAPFLGSYWFITAYILLYIFSPFLDIFVSNLKNNLDLYKKIIIILTLIIPIYGIYGTLYLSNITCSDFIIAVYWYLLDSYLKEIPNNLLARHPYLILFISMISVVLLEVVLALVATLFNMKTFGIENLIGRFSIFQIVAAISLFYIFKNFKIGTKGAVNFIAQSMLGVYLIHQNEIFRGILWNKIINLDYFYKYSSALTFTVMLLFGSLVIFGTCILIDLLRFYFVEKPVFNHVNCLDNMFNKLDKLINTVKNN